MALWQVFLCVLLFSLVIVIPPMLHTHILFLHLRHCLVLSADSVINCLFLTGRQTHTHTCKHTPTHARTHLTNHRWQFSFLHSVVKLELLNWVWYCIAVWFPQNLYIYYDRLLEVVNCSCESLVAMCCIVAAVNGNGPAGQYWGISDSLFLDSNLVSLSHIMAFSIVVAGD